MKLDEVAKRRGGGGGGGGEGDSSSPSPSPCVAPACGFIAYWLEHHTSNVKIMGSIPVEAWIFSPATLLATA